MKGTWDSRYQEYDALITYSILCGDCHEFTPYFGVAGLYLEQKMVVELSSPGLLGPGEGFVKWDSDYWGVGLRFGSRYQYKICDCLGMFASGHGTLLAGQNTAEFNQTFVQQFEEEFESEFSYKDDEICHFVPGYEIKVGFTFDTCVCDCDFSLRVGYEFVGWHNIPNPRHFTAASFTSTSPDIRTLGYHGLFAGLGISF